MRAVVGYSVGYVRSHFGSSPVTVSARTRLTLHRARVRTPSLPAFVCLLLLLRYRDLCRSTWGVKDPNRDPAVTTAVSAPQVMAANGDLSKDKNYYAGIWTCFACTLPNEWQATKCAGCGKSWKHKTSWTSWKKNQKQYRPWALAEPSQPSPPWRKWDNGPPGGLTKTPGGPPVFATAGGHGDGDEATRAGEIERVSKALEACAPLLGPKNEAVLGLQKQLEELNAAKPKALPIHVEVGKF